jgi:superfamily II DNA or RNA helicase
MLTASGYVTDASPELRRILTVRPFGEPGRPPPPSFKVFRSTEKYICVPQYFGKDRIDQRPVDKRNEPSRANINFVGELREDLCQKTALDSFQGAGVISLPCGYGKSIVGLAAAARLGVRTMIMVHKEFLADQWLQNIRRFCPGSSIGRVQGDRCELDNDFVICMIQTLCSREHPPRAFESIGFLMVDEAHHVCAKVFSQTMFKMCPRYTLGLSATPERKDGLTRILHWFLGPMVFSVSRNSTEVQVRPVIYSGPFPEPSKDLATAITDLTKIPERNTLLKAEIESLLQTNRNILVLTDRREHCHWIHQQFQESGLYIGGMSREQLEESAKKRLIVATFSLAQEGLDIPKLDTVIFATPKSDIVQASGRILRSKGNSPLIVDIVDHWNVFFSMFAKRRGHYSRMGFQSGGFSSPTGVCLL